MPQTDRSGTKESDPNSSLHLAEGSALNKLKNGQFDKDAVKLLLLNFI